jgi:hypothetical protein
LVPQQRRKGLLIELDQQKEDRFHALVILDLDQGVQEKAFGLIGTGAIKSFFYGDPQVVRIVKQKPVQPEAFFHFSFYEISLDRIADLAVNGNGKAAARKVVFQKI